VNTVAIRRAKLQSNHHHQQTNNIQRLTDRMPFLSTNQRCHSTEGKTDAIPQWQKLCWKISGSRSSCRSSPEPNHVLPVTHHTAKKEISFVNNFFTYPTDTETRRTQDENITPPFLVKVPTRFIQTSQVLFHILPRISVVFSTSFEDLVVYDM